MKNNFNKLIEVANSLENSSYKIIAETILKNFKKGCFLSQQKLSEEAHVSAPLITIFCQKIGYSGYREFLIYLKLDYEKYFSRNNINLNMQKKKYSLNIDYMREIYDNFFKDIILSSNFFEKFIKNLNKLQNLIIYNSHQTNKVGDFIMNLLNGKGFKSVKNFNPSENDINSWQNYCHANAIYLFFLLGHDTNEIMDAIQNNENREKIFIITSNGQKEKVQDFPNVFVISSHIAYNDFFYRTILLQTMFLIVCESLKIEKI
ncbi:hypothetical protein ESOMN_v1c01570 [Williamsoniiplasma somnilux]|uniref:HTH rpiR-type domain-containing protein n=1 Tax=Williamsoniiplasma somnilux TaxID=215578 RepID=A0A2K8NXH9_9MOLU|nr:MurR/RpiR family transcriptional regulator [Williamsoniiplasma somnilux]ATZ18542.1 hypothetical protein ESOMN_v1c01570 [Williamsoniiplasma somnilux]